MPLRHLLITALLITTATGCSRTITPTIPPSTAAGNTATELSVPTTAPVTHCPAHDGQLIEITAGTITCGQAADTVARYDFQGGKYQHIDAFTCYTGTAQTAPIILVCGAEDNQFSVSRIG